MPACQFELQQFIDCSNNQRDLTLCTAFNDIYKQCKLQNGLQWILFSSGHDLNTPHFWSETWSFCRTKINPTPPCVKELIFSTNSILQRIGYFSSVIPIRYTFIESSHWGINTEDISKKHRENWKFLDVMMVILWYYIYILTRINLSCKKNCSWEENFITCSFPMLLFNESWVAIITKALVHFGQLRDILHVFADWIFGIMLYLTLSWKLTLRTNEDIFVNLKWY